jgi:hypothetical protein
MTIRPTRLRATALLLTIAFLSGDADAATKKKKRKAPPRKKPAPVRLE